MNASLHTRPPDRARHTRGPLGGIMLIVIGFIALLWRFLPNDWMALWPLPLLGLAFFVWGFLAQEVGLLIPGGILTGIGAGVLLINALRGSYSDPSLGGIFMLTFAAGWALITAASRLIHRTVWWPLVVGGIIALVGVALIVSGSAPVVLEALAWLPPLLLIALGAWIVIRRSGWRPS